MQYGANKHILLRDRAHNARLTPEEYPEFEAALIAEGGHAFNAFAVAGKNGSEIVLVEPQSDEIVTELEGAYSVERRAEVLL